MKPYKNAISFQDIGGSYFVTHQPRISFFVTGCLLDHDLFKMEPLTFTRFMRAICANFIYLNYWRLMRFLVWRLKAFAVKDGELISWARFKPYLWIRETWQRVTTIWRTKKSAWTWER